MARGKVTFNITGGTPPYRVLFRNNTKSKEAYGGYFENPGIGKEIEIAEDASAGAYTLDIIDSNGCVVSEPGTIGTVYTVTFRGVNDGPQFSIDFDGDVVESSILSGGIRDDNRHVITRSFVPDEYQYIASEMGGDERTVLLNFDVINNDVSVVVDFNLATER